MKLFKLLLYIIFLFSFHHSYSQDCFSILSDASGTDLSLRLNEIELASCDLIDSLPEEYQDSFGVFYFGFYLHNDKYQDGLSEIINIHLQTIQSTHPYYLAIGINLNNENPNRVKVLINLPDEGNFSCLERGDIGLLASSYESKFKNDQTDLILFNIINDLKTNVLYWVDCCYFSRSTEDTCSEGCFSSDNILFNNYIENNNFRTISSEIVNGNYLTTSRVVVNSDFVIGDYSNLVADIEGFFNEIGDLESKAFIFDKNSFCEGDYFDFQDNSGSNIFIIIDDISQSYNLKIYGCESFYRTPLTDIEDYLITLVKEIYLKNYPTRSEIRANLYAWYRVCLYTPLHWTLTIAGFVCDICDAIDAGIYVLEGDYTNAAFSSIAIVPIIGSPAKVYIKVVTAKGGKAMLVFSAYGLRHFGRAAQLVTVIGKQTGKAAHHIIPWELFDKFELDAIKKLVEKGFHPNQSENGVHLYNKISGKNWAGEIVEGTFHGNHPKYTEYVRRRLNEISSEYGDNGDAILTEVTTKLIPELKAQMKFAEYDIKTKPEWAGKTLNDYFKSILENSNQP